MMAALIAGPTILARRIAVNIAKLPPALTVSLDSQESPGAASSYQRLNYRTGLEGIALPGRLPYSAVMRAVRDGK